jgi:hypothetical protein
MSNRKQNEIGVGSDINNHVLKTELAKTTFRVFQPIAGRPLRSGDGRAHFRKIR